MLVTGVTGRKTFCSTGDPPPLPRMCGSPQVHHVGAAPRLRRDHPAGAVHREATVEELARHPTQVLHGGRRDEEVLQGMRLAVGLLLYLTSDLVDARSSPETGRARRRHREHRLQVVDVGDDTGRTLLAAQHRAGAHESAEAGPSVRAHLRRARWPTYWTSRESSRPPFFAGYTRSSSTPTPTGPYDRWSSMSIAQLQQVDATWPGAVPAGLDLRALGAGCTGPQPPRPRQVRPLGAEPELGPVAGAARSGCDVHLPGLPQTHAAQRLRSALRAVLVEQAP